MLLVQRVCEQTNLENTGLNKVKQIVFTLGLSQVFTMLMHEKKRRGFSVSQTLLPVGPFLTWWSIGKHWYLLEECFSNFTVHVHQLEVLLKCRF